MKAPSILSRSTSRADWFAVVVTFFIFVRYFVELVDYSRTHPLWLDEILTTWLVRLGSPGNIYDALAKGAEYSPPGYPVLLLWWSKLAGASYLSLRSIAFVSVALAAITIFFLIRRYMDFSVSALASVLVLTGPLHVYAQQARPYALTFACFTFALLLWDGLDLSTHPRWNLAGITILLSAAITLHFYSVLYLVPFAVMEMLYSLNLRRLRMFVWFALAIAASSVTIWIPLARHIARFNFADNGPQFYATPTLHRFSQSLEIVLIPFNIFSRSHLLLLLLALFAASALYITKTRNHNPPSPLRPGRQLLNIAAGCAILPIATFTFALFVSGTYNLRYILPASISTIILLCFAAETLPLRQIFVPLSAIAIASHALVPRPVGVFTDNRAVLQAASKPYPIVMAEGLMFFQAQEDLALTPQQRARINYLILPQGYPLKDATNENLVTRWHEILPQLPAYPVQPFLQTHGCFYLFDSHQSADDLNDYLNAQPFVRSNTATVDKGTLDELCPLQLRN